MLCLHFVLPNVFTCGGPRWGAPRFECVAHWEVKPPSGRELSIILPAFQNLKSALVCTLHRGTC